MSEIDKRQSDLLGSAVAEASVCSEFVIKNFEGEQRDELLKKLDGLIGNYCMIENHMTKKGPILMKMKAEQEAHRSKNQWDDAGEKDGAQSSRCLNPDELQKDFENRMQSAMKNFNVKQQKFYQDYTKRVNSFVKQVDKSETDDEDLVMTESTETFIDPISKKTIVDPVKSRICNHTFSREPVLQLLKMKRKIKCPYMACGSKFTEGDLEEDTDMALNLRRLEMQNH